MRLYSCSRDRLRARLGQTFNQPCGWSINAVQNLNHTWAVFARANQASDAVTSIRRSFALGAAMNNPLGRNQWDQIGVAVGYSTPSFPPANPAGARNETVFETYWNWTLLGGVLLTPGVQFVINPALAPHRDHDWLLSLRATLML
ncbi:MAG: carbohydrate porin [Cyanobacteriota bacterium]